MRKILVTLMLLLLVCGICSQQAVATATIKVKFDEVTVTNSRVTVVISPADAAITEMPFNKMLLYGKEGESGDSKEITGIKLDSRRVQFTFDYSDFNLSDQGGERLFCNFYNSNDEWALVPASGRITNNPKVGIAKFVYKEENKAIGCYYFLLGPFASTRPEVVIE